MGPVVRCGWNGNEVGGTHKQGVAKDPRVLHGVAGMANDWNRLKWSVLSQSRTSQLVGMCGTSRTSALRIEDNHSQRRDGITPELEPPEPPRRPFVDLSGRWRELAPRQ